MPKEPPVRQFRKGTKSCIECRNRKLRCIPAADESQPCQNCRGRDRTCVPQVNVGRDAETIGVSSKDRISQLEQSVASLWAIVRDLKNELRPQSDLTPNDGAPRDNSTIEEESDNSDVSPMIPPSHLQQLFDNEYLDTGGGDAQSPEPGSDKASMARIKRARTRLQALMPSKNDVEVIMDPAVRGARVDQALFPTTNLAASREEMLAKFDDFCGSTADPVALAIFLVSFTLSLSQVSTIDPIAHSVTVGEPSKYIQRVLEAVEESVVSDDSLAGTIEGIETTIGLARLQLARTEIRKVWLMLRRAMALSELIGLPRAAQRMETTPVSPPPVTVHTSADAKLHSAATLWKSIRGLDRLVGAMFNLPLGTTAYGFPPPQSVMTPNGELISQEYCCYLAIIAAKVQEIDEAYISQRPETELIEKVFNAAQGLRSLSNMTPDTWWTLSSSSPPEYHLLQYWYNYFTVRTHVQLALRSGKDPQYMHSYLACLEACRSMAFRYVALRGLLPPAFFGGRVLDLQALTAAVFLLYNSQWPAAKQGMNIQDETDSSRDLALRMVQMMESVSEKSAPFGRQTAAAIRSLDHLLNQTDHVDSPNLTLRIPMLGKINVKRHSKPRQDLSKPSPQNNNAMNTATIDANQQSLWRSNLGERHPMELTNASGDQTNSFLPWSMDLMMDDFQTFDGTFGNDPWLSLDYFNVEG